MQNEIKFVEHIGLFSINRARPKSCVHATEYCKQHCYCAKMENLYMRHKDVVDQREEDYWRTLTGDIVKADLATKKKSTARVRLMSRGEALVRTKDILKVRDICEQNPDTVFMLPTRAWRSNAMFHRMPALLQGMPNLRLLFSTDPDCFGAAMNLIAKYMPNDLLARVTLTYFGLDEEWYRHSEAFHCPKTWDKKSGITCATCEGGCFDEDPSRLKIVHFKKH